MVKKKNMIYAFLIFLVLLPLVNCLPQIKNSCEKGSVLEHDEKPIKSRNVIDIEEKGNSLINKSGNTVCERIIPPYGFKRVNFKSSTFEYYLRNLPLKPDGSKVLYYDGGRKNKDVYEAVVNMDIGSRNLQQCADAVIRLRAEFLYSQKQYDKIHFNFTNGFRADYTKWMEGYRIVVNGNEVRWVKKSGFSNSYDSFRDYLDVVFTYAGTLSLSKELKEVKLEEMKIGDVFIQGGSPGHCVIVVDMVENGETGEKLFLLAQSYMPAQDIQILKNINNPKLSPWYNMNFDEELITPEWIFKKTDLRRFE